MNYKQYKEMFTAIPECKYRLPCGWCERLNDVCGICKEYMAEIIEVPKGTVKCDHNWVYTGDGYYCSHCGKTKCLVNFASEPPKVIV